MSESKPVTSDDLYRRSSQYQLWSFTPEELTKVKRDTNEKGRLAANSKFDQHKKKFLQDADSKKVIDEHPDEFTFEKLIDIVSFEEETIFLQFYCKSILETGQFFKMPTQVKATAIAFFKRFYLVNSVMEYHPKIVLYTVLFLAAKSENYFISIESFCKAIPKIESKDIIELEFNVLQSLKFTLFVHHPFKPLYGFYLDFQTILLFPHNYETTIDMIGKLYDDGKNWLITYAVLSDVYSLFTPPQIALAAMYDIDKKVTDRYLKKKFDDRDQYEAIVKTIRKCIKVAKNVPETNRQESIEIDKKCFYTLNPNKILKKKIKLYQKV